MSAQDTSANLPVNNQPEVTPAMRRQDTSADTSAPTPYVQMNDTDVKVADEAPVAKLSSLESAPLTKSQIQSSGM